MSLPGARSCYLPENLHIEHCMKMGDLFSLTLRGIVYIPNLHAGGEAVQVKREIERENGRSSWKTCLMINQSSCKSYNHHELRIRSTPKKRQSTNTLLVRTISQKKLFSQKVGKCHKTDSLTWAQHLTLLQWEGKVKMTFTMSTQA